MLSKIIRSIIRYPRLFLSIIILIVVLSGIIASDLSINPDFSTLINDDGQYNTNARKLEAAFGENNALTVLYKINDKSIISNKPADLREESLDTATLNNLLLQSQYVTRINDIEYSQNGKYARVTLSVFEPNSIGGLVDVKNELQMLIKQAPRPPGVDLSITGLPTLLDRVSTLLITDNLRTVLITFVLVFAVLILFFRRIKIALIGIAAPMASLIIIAATMVMLKIQVTLTLAAVGVIILGLGVDYSIHLITAYVRHLQEGHKPKRSIIEAFNELDIALMAAYLTTLAGFAALMLGVSPSSQAQGLVLSIAITIIFFVTIIIIPLLLVLFVTKADEKVARTPPLLDKIFDKLAYYQTRHPWQIISVIILITIVMIIGASKVSFSTSNSNWIPDDDPVSKDFRELTYAFGDSDRLILVVESTDNDLRDLQTIKDLQVLTTKLKGLDGIDKVISPIEGFELEKASIYESAEQRAIRGLFNNDYTLTTITLESSGFEVDEQGESLIIKQAEDIIKNTPVYGAKISLFGDVVRFDELGKSLKQDAAKTTSIGLILVFITATTIYLSLTVGVISLIPIILAVIWAVGLMGFFNVPFTSLSTGIVSLVLGVGVDFSIHLVNSTNYSLKKINNITKAITKALHTSGGAIFISSATTFFGFMALTFAQLLGTRRLGLSLALSILAVFVVSLLFVPAVLMIRYRTKALKS